MAAGTTVWSGVIDGDFTDNGNWSNNSPAADFNAIIDGAVSLDTNLTNGALELALVFIASTFSGNVGGVGNYLGLQTDTLVDKGTGDTYFKTTDTAGGPVDTTLVICDKPAGTLYLDCDGNSDFVRVVCLRGNVVIAGTGTITIDVLDIAYKNNPQTDAKITISAGCGATVLTNMIGGQLISAAVLTALVLNGGEVQQSTAAITTLRQTNGVCQYKTSSTLGAAHILGGVLDLTKSADAKTITDLYQFPGAEVRYLPTITTITNEHSFGDEEL